LAHHVQLSDDGGVLEGDLVALGAALSGRRRTVALTGAGISVESGIPDFRGEDGLWSTFEPMEYATLTCFLRDPSRAWQLYRALGRTLLDREPNPAHRALARLESDGRLAGVVTQNVDGLHQAAGSHTVLEIHGEHGNLHCVACGYRQPFEPRHLEDGPVPHCPACDHALKPNVVLFEEPVRDLLPIHDLVADCDVMLVVGTSAEVSPASLLPSHVRSRGGTLLEFNLQPTGLTRRGLGPDGVFVQGPVGKTLPLAAETASGHGPGGVDR